MNLKYIGWLLAFSGQVLIALGFFCFIDVISIVGESICWLDFVTVSEVYWLCLCISWHHPINLRDYGGKEAAGLGIRWGALGLYSVLAIGVVAAGLSMEGDPKAFPFKWQLLAQLGLLFLFLSAVYLSGVVNAHAAQVHARENRLREGKDNIRIEIQELISKAERNTDLPVEVMDRLRNIAEEVRFLSPSASVRAGRLDENIVEDMRMLGYALTDYGMNRTQVNDLLNTLELDFRNRRSIC